MKKTLLAAALLLAATGVKAQWFDFSSNNHHFDIGIHGGIVGQGCEYDYYGFGGSISVCGVYLDAIYSGPKHKYDNHVTQTLYNDSTAFNINLGYQIPILPWLRVMPVVGYTTTDAGITDASTVNIEVSNDNEAVVTHKYYVTDGSRQHYVTFGGGLFIQPLSWLSIYGVYTNHSVYGGLSFNLGSPAVSEDALSE